LFPRPDRDKRDPLWSRCKDGACGVRGTLQSRYRASGHDRLEDLQGIEFRFPQGEIPASGGYAIVAQDPDAIMAGWPYLSGLELASGQQLVCGPFEGRPSNEGDRIIVCHADCRVMDNVGYRLGFPWPTVARPYSKG